MASQEESGREPRSGKTANDRFKQTYGNWLSIGIIGAVLLHFAFIQLFPQLQTEDMGPDAEEMEAVELPPEVEIPPPPEQIARPATPTVAEAQVQEDVTIAPTTFEENPVEDLPPPPRSGSPSDRPSFIPRDVDPRLTNNDEIQRILQRQYPRSLRDAGIGGRVVLWLFVDENGDVQQTQVQQSSGYDGLDQAGERVAQQMEFEPAINRDQPIAVWIAQPITFSVQ